LNHQTRSRKHIYLDVKNEWGDSKIDYIINPKIGLLKIREVSVNSSLPGAYTALLDFELFSFLLRTVQLSP
jgi:hypothetical protein